MWRVSVTVSPLVAQAENIMIGGWGWLLFVPPFGKRLAYTNHGVLLYRHGRLRLVMTVNEWQPQSCYMFPPKQNQRYRKQKTIVVVTDQPNQSIMVVDKNDGQPRFVKHGDATGTREKRRHCSRSNDSVE